MRVQVGYIIGCTCCLFVLNIGLGFAFFSAGLFVQKAKAWEVQTAWRQTQCKVLTAGVSCTDEESRSTCGGYKAGTMPNQSVPVFLTEQIAVCPGTYWCAKEGDMCNCTGEITYSPELFDGYVYTVPEAEKAYKVKSDGMWKCGTDQSGVQYKVDPAPWHVKHCFCTPDGIQQILQPYGAEHLHKKECSETVNFDFENQDQGIRQFRRRLREATAATQRARSLLQRARERLHEPPRQLRSVRRRRTFRYTPWALVTVEDGIAETQHIRCAYEYGVPQASGQFYHGDGAYIGGVWDAENVALGWGKDPVRDCWVRTQSHSVEGGFCGLSMTIPGKLKENAKGMMHLTSIFFYSCIIFTVLWVLLVGFLWGKTILEACEGMLSAIQSRLPSASTRPSEQQNLINTGT